MSEQVEDTKSLSASKDHSVESKVVEGFSKKLEKAKKELENTSKKIILKTESGDSKVYTPVAVRVDIFRKHFGLSGRIISRIKEKNDQEVIIEATLDILMDGKFVRIANAYANKTRYQASINQFANMIENTETSAIGRVLANIGLSGGEFASLEDLIEYKKINNDGLDIENLAIQKEQIKEINILLKEKNYKISELNPEINDVSELNYQEAHDLIETLLNKRKKRTAVRSGSNNKKNKEESVNKEEKDKENKDNEEDNDNMF